LSTEIQKFSQHTRKVGLLSFNKSCAEIIASADVNSVHVWNILNAESYSRIQFGDTPMSLDWNPNGSLYGLTTKEKLIYICDPRANKIVVTAKGHDSSRPQKMGFIDGDYFFSTGVNKSNERQLKLYDIRKVDNGMTESVQALPIDTQTGIIYPYYDSDTGLLFVPGRGEGNIKYFEFSNGEFKFASEYKTSNPQKGIAPFPKRAMNYNKNEIARFAKLTNNALHFVSFYWPKRNEGYDATCYPDCLTGEPGIGVEEWLKGEK
jgi:coronin-1B/1C/6